MASDMSVYLGNKVCRWLAGNAMPAAPAACYVGLFNGNPKTSGVEVTDTINAARPGRDHVRRHRRRRRRQRDHQFGGCRFRRGGRRRRQPRLCRHLRRAPRAANLLFSKALPGGPFAVAAGTPIKFLTGDLTFTIGAAS